MKSIVTLLTVLGLASFGFAAEGGKKGAAEGGKKGAEGAKKADPAAIFKKKDANSDGKLSKEEFLKGAKPDRAAQMEKSFGAKDKDKDGSLSLDEFKATGGKKKAA